MSALGSGLAKNEFLQELDVSWNKIRTKGFTAFFNAIKDNYTLNKLNLANNGLGDSTLSIGPFLSKNSTLNFLDLSGNRISDVLIQVVGKALETNCKFFFVKPATYILVLIYLLLH